MKFTVQLIFATIFLIVDSYGLASPNAAETAGDAFKKYGKQVTSISTKCLSFTEESSSEVRVREKHGANCGGDPATSPTLAYLRIKGKQVFILDAFTNEYKELNSKYKVHN